MNIKDSKINEGMFIELPSILRKININELNDKKIQEYLSGWLAHSTAFYRMTIDGKKRIELISKLNVISIFNLPEYVYQEFKNIMDLFSRGYWLASISTAGTICEGTY